MTDLKEFVPEGLFLGALAFDASPFAGKRDRVVADFVPGNRHGGNERAPKICQRQFPPECLRSVFIDLGDEGINTVALLTPTQNSPPANLISKRSAAALSSNMRTPSTLLEAAKTL